MNTTVSNTTDYFELDHTNELPVLIRKIHLAKCLEEGNWEAIRKDLNERPIEDVDGNSSEEEILEELNYYGVYNITPGSEQASTLITIWSNQSDDESDDEADEEKVQAQVNEPAGGMSIMEVANLIKDVVGYKGFFRYNKPDDAMSKLDLHYSNELIDGIKKVYQGYVNS